MEESSSTTRNVDVDMIGAMLARTAGDGEATCGVLSIDRGLSVVLRIAGMRDAGNVEAEAPRDARSRPSRGVVAVIALATPAALGLETLARTLLLPAELAQLRQELRPVLTPLAWALLGITALAIPLGFLTLRALRRRFLAKVEATGATERRRREAVFEAMFVATSVPQIPAIMATFALTAGSEALPVLVTVALSAAAVVAIAWRAGASPPASP